MFRPTSARNVRNTMSLLNCPSMHMISSTRSRANLSNPYKHSMTRCPPTEMLKFCLRQYGWIRLSRMPKQQEPTNLRYLKNEIRQRWWMTSLLDIIKEVDFRVGFTDSFQSLTGQQRLAIPELQKRLLLCLFGLGTNTGLTSVSMGNHGVSYANLQYVRRRFVAKDALRQAISCVIDATLAIRQPQIWGETTTWCASDSKQFASWNQNLLTQWHKRYHNAGVMVYWHVAKQSLCIHSQLKAPSSSEVASMLFYFTPLHHHAGGPQLRRYSRSE